jgi:TfoX/Sxy family transcriptional regulator of competence genes
MATDRQFIEFAAEQLKGLGTISYRKMFGEYMIYIDAKPIFLVCDDTVFVKMHEELRALLVDNDAAYPYPGAKLHYVIDIEDEELLREIVMVALPLVKLKK